MCICIQVFMWTYVSDSLEYTPSRGIAVSWSFVTTFKLVSGHTVSQGRHLLGRAHRISDRPLLTIPASSPITSQALWVAANGAVCRPCCFAVLFLLPGLLLRFLSVCLSLFPFVQVPLSFTPQLSCHPPLCSLFPHHFPPPELISSSAGSGWGCILSIMHPVSNCRGSCPGQLLWFCIREHLAGNRCVTNLSN